MLGLLLFHLHRLFWRRREGLFRPHRNLGPYRTAQQRAVRLIRRRLRFRRAEKVWKKTLPILLWMTEPFVFFTGVFGAVLCALLSVHRSPIPEPEPTTPPPNYTFAPKRNVIWARIFPVDPPCVCVHHSADDPEIWVELVLE